MLQLRCGTAYLRTRGPVAKAFQQCPFDFDGERGPIADAARLFEADGRGFDRLVGSAFGGQGDPGRRARQNRLAACVDADVYIGKKAGKSEASVGYTESA
jgi:hypothetical protein